MQRLIYIILSFKEYFVLFLTASVSLGLIISNNNSQVELFRLRALEVVAEVNEAVSWLPSLLALQKRNDELLRRNMELSSENNYLKEALIENIKLKKLLEFKERKEWDYVFARVIGKNSSGVINSIILDIGEDRNIVKNMPLVTDQGLVGKVIAVRGDKALGQIILDRNFRVSVKVQRTRVNGILRWEHDDVCFLNEVPKTFDVQVGDVVVTSGLSNIFPEKIKVGVVTFVSDTKPGLFKEIKVKPSVDFSKLEELFIISNFRPQIPDFSVLKK
jgi:rod shape-determining protein MreC